MPELTAHSIPTPLPLPPSLYATPKEDSLVPPAPQVALPPLPTSQSGLQVAAVPPVVDPAAWEDFAVFRETFLMYITPLRYNAALRSAGEMLFSMILEAYNPWPGWPESSTRTELRAAVADLRHLQGFLQSVGKEREVSSLSVEDIYLSRLAAKLAPKLGKLASLLETELGEGKL
jgi:hypothetical protein